MPTVNNNNNSNESRAGVSGEPLVDPETMKFRRAVTNDSQVYEIRRRLIEDNKERNNKNAQILRKYNDEQPFSPQKMKAANQSWRNNRATGFLSGFVKRVVPSYKKMIDNAPSLTSARLAEESSEADEKGQVFRTEITRTIRQWHGWNDFTERLIVEDVLFGYASALWPDEYAWKPLLGRQDEALFPNGSTQYSQDALIWCFDQNFYPHELADKLVEPEISEAAGWFPDNIVESINNAQPDDRDQGDETDVRKFEDTVRENSVGASFTTDVREIEASHVFVTEVTGKVSHFIVDTKSKDLLYKKLDKFDTPQDTLSLFAIEVGNGNLHGSKGLGRTLYNSHVAVERSRNLVADNLYLSTLLLIKARSSSKAQSAITVNHPLCVINEDIDIVQERFQIDVDAFFRLDDHITRLAELMAGAFMPSVGGSDEGGGGEQKTAAEINYVASIEQSLREGILARFWGQFQGMVSTMQRRICSADNIRRAREIIRLRQQQNGIVRRAFVKVIEVLAPQLADQFEPEDSDFFEDQDAVDCVVRMINKGLTVREIIELSSCPAQYVLEDDVAARDQALSYALEAYRGDPDIDQVELKKRDITSKMGVQAAEKLVINPEDPTVEVEQTRLQILELDSLLQGETVPVSPRDNDMVHLKAMLDKLEPLLQNASPEMITPETLPVYQAVSEHGQAHLQAAQAEGADPEMLAPFAEILGMLQETVGGGAQAPGGMEPPAGAGDIQSGGAEITPMQDVGRVEAIDNPAAAASQKPLSKGMQPIIPTPPV